jgi:beta-barrel assembly-enhancing protease
VWRRVFAAAGLSLLAGCATAPVAPASADHQPDAIDEAGLWQVMEREENLVRDLPLRVRDPELTAYLDELVCQLAGDLCGDIRVYVLRLPYFNATMAPNGMMHL